MNKIEMMRATGKQMSWLLGNSKIKVKPANIIKVIAGADAALVAAATTAAMTVETSDNKAKLEITQDDKKQTVRFEYDENGNLISADSKYRSDIKNEHHKINGNVSSSEVIYYNQQALTKREPQYIKNINKCMEQMRGYQAENLYFHSGDFSQIGTKTAEKKMPALIEMIISLFPESDQKKLQETLKLNIQEKRRENGDKASILAFETSNKKVKGLISTIGDSITYHIEAPKMIVRGENTDTSTSCLVHLEPLKTGKGKNKTVIAETEDGKPIVTSITPLKMKAKQVKKAIKDNEWANKVRAVFGGRTPFEYWAKIHILPARLGHEILTQNLSKEEFIEQYPEYGDAAYDFLIANKDKRFYNPVNLKQGSIKKDFEAKPDAIVSKVEPEIKPEIIIPKEESEVEPEVVVSKEAQALDKIITKAPRRTKHKYSKEEYVNQLCNIWLEIDEQINDPSKCLDTELFPTVLATAFMDGYSGSELEEILSLYVNEHGRQNTPLPETLWNRTKALIERGLVTVPRKKHERKNVNVENSSQQPSAQKSENIIIGQELTGAVVTDEAVNLGSEIQNSNPEDCVHQSLVDLCHELIIQTENDVNMLQDEKQALADIISEYDNGNFSEEKLQNLLQQINNSSIENLMLACDYVEEAISNRKAIMYQNQIQELLSKISDKDYQKREEFMTKYYTIGKDIQELKTLQQEILDFLYTETSSEIVVEQIDTKAAAYRPFEQLNNGSKKLIKELLESEKKTTSLSVTYDAARNLLLDIGFVQNDTKFTLPGAHFSTKRAEDSNHIIMQKVAKKLDSGVKSELQNVCKQFYGADI